LNLFEALILGIVQGASEFLPISSSAHLILIPWWLGWEEPSILYSVVVHLGTLVAVLIYFRRELRIFFSFISILRNRRISTAEERVFLLLMLGTAPAVVAGLLAEKFFAELFFDPALAAATLTVTAMILMVSERSTPGFKRIAQITALDAFIIGLAQAFAVLPGISRSGSTIAAGLSRDIKREDTAHYSFLLSIPIIAGAGAKEALNVLTGSVAVDSQLAIALLVGFVASASVGYVCIAFLLSFIKRRPLIIFAAYCAIFGGLSLLAIAIRG
jgi:undecaprenyl-diphosphatase